MEIRLAYYVRRASIKCYGSEPVPGTSIHQASSHVRHTPVIVAKKIRHLFAVLPVLLRTERDQ